MRTHLYHCAGRSMKSTALYVANTNQEEAKQKWDYYIP